MRRPRVCLLTTTKDLPNDLPREFELFDWVYVYPGDDLVKVVGNGNLDGWVTITNQVVEPALSTLYAMPSHCRKYWHDASSLYAGSAFEKIYDRIDCLHNGAKFSVIVKMSGQRPQDVPAKQLDYMEVSPACFISILNHRQYNMSLNTLFEIHPDALESPEIKYFMSSMWPTICDFPHLTKMFLQMPFDVDDYLQHCKDFAHAKKKNDAKYNLLPATRCEMQKLVPIQVDEPVQDQKIMPVQVDNPIQDLEERVTNINLDADSSAADSKDEPPQVKKIKIDTTETETQILKMGGATKAKEEPLKIKIHENNTFEFKFSNKIIILEFC